MGWGWGKARPVGEVGWVVGGAAVVMGTTAVVCGGQEAGRLEAVVAGGQGEDCGSRNRCNQCLTCRQSGSFRRHRRRTRRCEQGRKPQVAIGHNSGLPGG